MATLNKHGAELARFEYATSTVVIMADGHILKNSGGGFKLHRKCKPGVDPLTVVKNHKESFAARRAACPALDEYARLLRGMVGLKNAWKLHATVELMPNDPDGVWSTLDDEGCHLDLDDVVKLCHLYGPAQMEYQDYRREIGLGVPAQSESI